MKVKNLLSMSALLLAAVMISCNGDDLVGEVISPDDANPKMMKFTATLAPKNESTRLLEDNETEITDTWEEGDLVAMIIQGKMYQGTVTSLDSDGSAYVTGEIPAEIESGTSITFRHPFAAVDENGEFLPNLLTMQDGTLNDIDVRTGLSEETGVLHVTDEHSEGLTARLKERIVFENKVAICRFRFTDKDDSPIDNIEGVNIFDDKGNRLYYVHLPHEGIADRSTVYVAMEPIDPVQRLTFRVTTTKGDKICTGDINAKLLKGLYYKTTLSLKKQKDLTGVEITPDLEWAPENIGDGAGDYFAWAELTGHTRTSGWMFNPEDAPYYDSGRGPNGYIIGYTKYDPTHQYDEPLELMDDAAHVNWGGDWRMPTSTEMYRLIDETISEAVPKGNEKNPFDVAGRMYSNKNDQSKFIVMPAAGCFFYYGMMDPDYGVSGCYRTKTHRDSRLGTVTGVNSTLDQNPVFIFNPSGTSNGYMGYWARSYGMTIRPVRDKK